MIFKGLNINIILLSIFIVVGGTYTFGLTWYNFSIPTPVFNITEGLALMIYLLIATLVFKRLKVNYSITPTKYIYFFILLFLFELVKNLVLMEGSIKSIIDGFKNYYTLFLFFPIITIIRTREQFRLFTQIIIIIGLLNVLVYFFQFATGTVLPASSGSWDHGVFRVNHPGFNVIPIAMLLILGRILYPASNSNPILNYFILLVFIAAFFVSVSKGSITASLVSILVVLAYHNRSKIQNFLLYVFLGLIGIVLSFIILINIFHFRASSITERFSDEIENVGEDGSSSQVRGEMIGTKMEYILLNHPIFGVGFVYYKPEEGEKKWKYYKNPIAVVGDATYQNIVIVTGYLGLIFWLLNLYKSFLLGKKIFKKVNDPFLKSVAIALIGIPIFGLLHGFSSNYFSTRGFIFITIMSSYTFLLFKFTLQEFQKNENSHT